MEIYNRNQSITTHIKHVSTNQLEQSAAAEATIAYHKVIHHQSFKTSDCDSELYPEIFVDSLAAKHYASKRNKTAAITKSIFLLSC